MPSNGRNGGRRIPQFFQETLTDLYRRVQEYLPTAITALLLALAGLALAAILRALLTRLVAGIVRRLAANRKYGPSVALPVLDSLPRLAGGIVFWLTLLIFGSAALERLDFQIFAGLLGQFTEYLPNVFLAMVVLFAGLAGGRFARQTATSALGAASIGGTELIGRLCQASIVLVAAGMAADQIGVDSTFMMLIVGIGLGTTLGGMALAFGIGSGPVVANIIASYYVRRMYRAGLNVRIGTLEGRIIEIRPTTVALDTPDGRLQVPCRRFIDDVSVLLRES